MNARPSHLAATLMATGLFLVLSSCTYDPYLYDPEGVTYSSLPVGYTSLVIGGSTYWHRHGHYCRYRPGHGYVVVRPPYRHRPPGHRPPGHRSPGHRPEHPIYRPPGSGPGYRPPGSRPVTRPTTRPTTRPSTRPSTRPTGHSAMGSTSGRSSSRSSRRSSRESKGEGDRGKRDR